MLRLEIRILSPKKVVKKYVVKVVIFYVKKDVLLYVLFGSPLVR